MSTDPQGGERHDGALGALVRALGCSYEETFSIASGSIPSLQNQPFTSKRPLGSYDFLIGPLLYADTLREAEAFARASGVAPHEALLALGWITADDYAALLGAALGLEVIANRPFRLLRRRPSTRSILTDGVLASAVIGEVEGQSRLLLDCTAFSPDAINELMARPDLTAWPPVLVTRRGLAEAILRGEKQALIGAAVWGHARNRPLQSAAFGVPLRQALKIAVATGLVIGAAAVVPGAAIAVSTALLTLPFLAIVGLRSASLPAVFRRTKPPPVALEASVPSDAELPAYTVLVALYREAAVLAQLVAALSRLDYPKAKLDIKLVLEEVDAETRRAAAKLNLPAYFEIIVVPNAAPRTKPKALNFALPFARGQYLVIFDAEDIPEPDQLRKAVAAFQRGPAELVCLQARLGIYNWRLNWLTRQFAIEYTALFDAILPTLARLGLPLPLGGTSNHFKTGVLRTIGAWDAFNVTEDADLGIRLARHGLACGVIDSTTWEQAPASFGNWLRQRTRWLKGYMQTYLVHMRDVALLRRELGTFGFIGFQAMLGGMILSALVHPLFYILLAAEFATGDPFEIPETTFGRWMLGLAALNLALGYLVSIVLGAVAVLRRGWPGLALSAFMMPVYWLMISLAAYRGLYHLAVAPHRWEKTEHTPRTRLRRGTKREKRPKSS